MMIQMQQTQEPTKIIDPIMLLAVINNQTFFTLLRDQNFSSIMEAVSKQIKDTLYEPIYLKANPIDNKEDHPIILGLFNILNMRLKVNLPNTKSYVA